MMRRLALIIAAASLTAPASAQLRLPINRGRPPQPVLLGIDALRAEFAAQSGATTVYFPTNGVGLSAQARTVLAAQAAWLRRHPEIVVRIEGDGDSNDTRAHALAIGARRAEAVRDYLILLGIPAAQLSVSSWGKERPGAGRATTVLVR